MITEIGYWDIYRRRPELARCGNHIDFADLLGLDSRYLMDDYRKSMERHHLWTCNILVFHITFKHLFTINLSSVTSQIAAFFLFVLCKLLL